MRLKLSLVLLLTVLFGCSHLATAAKPLSLWLIESESASVYLLGSIHVMREDMYPLPAPIEEAFELSSTTVFEVDMKETVGDGASQLLREKGFYANGKSIYSELSDETLALLKSYSATNDLDIREFEQVRPWMISVNVALMELRKLGFDADRGIDLHFQTKARAENKPVLALETFREQIDLLSGDTPDVQELGLKLALKYRDEAPEFINQLISAWSSGNADLMYEVSALDYQRDPKLEAQFERLLDRRNEKMASKLSVFLDTTDETYFVVIGALHMGGDHGLLRLLGTDYKIRQIYHSSN
jgi:uncharacterized protein YbaP (TraB family)